MLKYALYKSNLPQSTDRYVAITQVETTATMDDLISDMTSRGSTLTRAEALSTWEEFTLAIRNRLARGENISTSLFYIGQDINGDFDNADDGFKTNRNSVVYNFVPGSELKEVATKVQVQRVEAVKIMPIIKDLTDFATAAKDKLSIGNTARISGSSLKIDTTDATQGIFLLPTTGGAEVKINTLIDNLPSNLTFLVPATLAAGTYKLEVRVKINKTKELRVTALATTLTAA